MPKSTKIDYVELDGSRGEGGGQILRTALTLSMTSGRAFRMKNIRSKRKKPGLMRQHLTCVLAAQRVCGARVEGAELRSGELTFEPGPICGGDYRFAIGSAGSTTLVLQTLLPALLLAGDASSVEIEGGTHNEMAPSADFLERSYLPVLRRMGARVEFELVRHGFFPAGGGCVRARVQPCGGLTPIELIERGEIESTRGTAMVAGLSGEIALRELAVLKKKLTLSDDTVEIRQLDDELGPGNVVSVEVEARGLRSVFTGFGRRGRSAESVASGVVDEVREYLGYGAAVEKHLADQLLVPMAIARGGVFSTGPLSMHSVTNIETVSAFGIASIGVQETGRINTVRLQPT